MRKLFLVVVVAISLFGCTSSPYVGEWKTAEGETLVLNPDGSLKANWSDSDGTQIKREGTWQKDGEGIKLNGTNSAAEARIVQDKLIIETQNKVRRHFIRQQVK